MKVDVKSVLIGALAVLLLVVVFDGHDAQAQAGGSGGGGDAGRDLIAVTGSYGSGSSVLYLVDTKTRHMAVYRTENGRRLELVAARDFEYDLKLESYNDQSEGGFTPRELRRAYPDSIRPAGTTTRSSTDTTTPARPGGG